MNISNVLLGLATGIPVMIVVGPIALLLVDQGLRRGFKGGYPAAIGVAGADLVYSSLAAVAGMAAAKVLAPVESWLQIAAVTMLCAMAARIALQAWRELKPTEAVPARELAPAVAVVADQRTDHHRSNESGMVLVPVGAADTSAGSNRSGTPETLVERLVLAGGFFGITAVNPITIVIFATIVMSGRRGVGSPGWVIGMVAASLMVNMTFLAVGHTLGAVFNEGSINRLQLGGAALMVLLGILLLAG